MPYKNSSNLDIVLASHTDSRSVVEFGLRMLSVALRLSEDKIVSIRSLPEQPPSLTTSIEAVRQTPLPAERFDAIKWEAFVPLILAHYRNQLLHLFLCESLVALSLRSNGVNGTGHYTGTISKSVSITNTQ